MGRKLNPNTFLIERTIAIAGVRFPISVVFEQGKQIATASAVPTSAIFDMEFCIARGANLEIAFI